MPRNVFVFDPPERFVVGTVGEPGQRTFYLQARGDGRVVSVALEKGQVSLLADRAADLLDELLRQTGGATSVPAVAPTTVNDLDPLDAPIEEEFRVGALGLGWDLEDERLVIEAQAMTDDPEAPEPIIGDDSPEGPDVLRIRITGAMARAFIARAQAVVSAGRPPCPFCSQPLDPSGHICPRANGYRR
jgi:uncharacterized repeat protein (TIGR03847 family)